MTGRLALLALMLAAVAGCAGLPAGPPVDAQPSARNEQSAGRQIVVTLHNPPSAGLRGAGSTWRGWSVGAVYSPPVTMDVVVQGLAADYGLKALDAWPIHLLGVHCIAYEIAGEEPRDALLARLRADARVESAQPMFTFATSVAGEAWNDPYFDLQAGLASLQVPRAQRVASGRGVRVAIVDTGADLAHPELSGRIVGASDFVRPRQANPGPMDAAFLSDRHGTAVAGVIGARAGNAEGIVGVAPSAGLIVLKACWPVAPQSPESRCNSFTLAEAIAAAVESGADVLNLSLAGPPDPLLERLVRIALGRGLVVVGAAPETGTPAQASFPTSIPGVVAARATERGTTRSDAVSAPGQDVMAPRPGGGYDFLSGSSLAAAHISGVAALLREASPGLDQASLARALAAAVVTRGSGRPSLDACAALSAAGGADRCEATPAD